MAGKRDSRARTLRPIRLAHSVEVDLPLSWLPAKRASDINFRSSFLHRSLTLKLSPLLLLCYYCYSRYCLCRFSYYANTYTTAAKIIALTSASLRNRIRAYLQVEREGFGHYGLPLLPSLTSLLVFYSLIHSMEGAGRGVVSSRTSSMGPSPSKYHKVMAPGSVSSNRPKEVRHRLSQYHTFDHAVELLKKSFNIVVLSGAGISTSLGIPDFRSDSGLFTKLSKHGYSDPEDLFHIDTFRVDPDTFFEVVANIVPPVPNGATPRFTPTHAFIKLIEDNGKLLTNYTQNIDDLEAAANISKDKVIQCHGSFATATCCSCGRVVRADLYLPKVRKGIAPKCPRCLKRPSQSERCKPQSTGKKRKRQHWEDTESDIESGVDATRGIFKPDIVFYGEKVSQKFWPRFDQDKTQVDLVFIIGTSLQVEPVKNILTMIPPGIPQIYISKTPCTGGWPDIELLGQCDVITAELAKRAGWRLDPEMNLIGKDNKVVVEDALLGHAHQHIVRLTMGK